MTVLPHGMGHLRHGWGGSGAPATTRSAGRNDRRSGLYCKLGCGDGSGVLEEVSDGGDYFFELIVVGPVAGVGYVDYLGVLEEVGGVVLSDALLEAVDGIDDEHGAGDLFPQFGQLFEPHIERGPGVGVVVVFPGIGAVFILI